MLVLAIWLHGGQAMPTIRPDACRTTPSAGCEGDLGRLSGCRRIRHRNGRGQPDQPPPPKPQSIHRENPPPAAVGTPRLAEVGPKRRKTLKNSKSAAVIGSP